MAPEVRNRNEVRRNGFEPGSVAGWQHACPKEVVGAQNRNGSRTDEIVGESTAIKKMLGRLDKVATTRATVLILGETGTGKELVACAIHQRSPRREHPLIAVNCAALPANLVECELFGHEKGAFTGATSSKAGRFELADGGTLFLDEIGDLAEDLQIKLLRVLQEGSFERVGSTRTRKVDVRVIAATHCDLRREIEDGRFRADLFYRLHVVPIELPPLRERREDIPVLVSHFITAKEGELGRRRIERVPEPVMEKLASYHWPGNVRELRNFIDRALILAEGPALSLDEWQPAPGQRSANGAAAGPRKLEDVERQHILAILEECRWRVSGPGNTADVLGLHPSTLRNRMKRLGIARSAANGRSLADGGWAPVQ